MHRDPDGTDVFVVLMLAGFAALILAILLGNAVAR